MASKSLSQVELAVMSWADAQFSNWQSLIKDGRKISKISLTMDISSTGERSYDIGVEYLEPTNPVTSS